MVSMPAPCLQIQARDTPDRLETRSLCTVVKLTENARALGSSTFERSMATASAGDCHKLQI